MINNEFNGFTNQLNYNSNEFNKVNIINTENQLKTDLFNQENNKNISYVKTDKKKKNFLLPRFIMLLALAALVQPVFYIPIFSDIFSPSPPVSTAVTTPQYVFSSVAITDNKLTFSLTIENADLETENYCLYLVKQVDATDEYINSIPNEVRESEQKNIINKTDTYSFVKYITLTGSAYINPETDYSVIVVKENKIVQSYNMTSASKIYLSYINVYFESGNIKIKLKTDSSFTGFGKLLIQVTNLTDSTWGAEHNGIDRTTGSEEDLSSTGNTHAFAATASSVDQYFEVKIYCVTTDPEKIALPDTTLYNTEYYYLIYTYDETLILEGE